MTQNKINLTTKIMSSDTSNINSPKSECSYTTNEAGSKISANYQMSSMSSTHSGLPTTMSSQNSNLSTTDFSSHEILPLPSLTIGNLDNPAVPSNPLTEKLLRQQLAPSTSSTASNTSSSNYSLTMKPLETFLEECLKLFDDISDRRVESEKIDGTPIKVLVKAMAKNDKDKEKIITYLKESLLGQISKGNFIDIGVDHHLREEVEALQRGATQALCEVVETQELSGFCDNLSLEYTILGTKLSKDVFVLLTLPPRELFEHSAWVAPLQSLHNNEEKGTLTLYLKELEAISNIEYYQRDDDGKKNGACILHNPSNSPTAPSNSSTTTSSNSSFPTSNNQPTSPSTPANSSSLESSGHHSTPHLTENINKIITAHMHSSLTFPNSSPIPVIAIRGGRLPHGEEDYKILWPRTLQTICPENYQGNFYETNCFVSPRCCTNFYL